MFEVSLLEIIKGIGKLFINPLFYWIIVLFIATSYRRIKKERDQFGTKIFPFFSESKSTIWISILGCTIISIIAITLGIVFTLDIIIIFIIVMIVLSITASLSFLSASYTIGISFLVALFLPYLHIVDYGIFSNTIKVEYFVGLAFLAGLLLFLESMMLLSKKAKSFPDMIKSERGIWVGRHHVKRMAFIPFFCLVPATEQLMNIPLFPFFQLGGETFMLVLFPFVIGYDYKVTSELPTIAAKRIGQTLLFLSVIVIAVAVVSIYFPIISIAAILIAIIGKEWLMYVHRKINKYEPNIYRPLHTGVMVLSTIPDSPADRLGIQIGETIIKVNEFPVDNKGQFYEALQNSGAFFKIDIQDIHGEVRFINSALYEKDHHELGVIFVEKYY